MQETGSYYNKNDNNKKWKGKYNEMKLKNNNDSNNEVKKEDNTDI